MIYDVAEFVVLFPPVCRQFAFSLTHSLSHSFFFLRVAIITRALIARHSTEATVGVHFCRQS